MANHDYNLKGAHSYLKLILVIPILFFNSAISGLGQESQNTNPAQTVFKSYIKANPFQIEKNNRLIPGGTFTIHLTDSLFKDKIKKVYLQKIQKNADLCNGEGGLRLDSYWNEIKQVEQSKFDIVVKIPLWNPDLKRFINPSFFKGFLSSHDAELVIMYEDGQNLTCVPFRVEISEPFWAWFWAIAALILSTLVAWLIIPRKSIAPDKRENIIIRILKFPLRSAITPDGRYSLSLTQVVIWTYVILFGLTFVWKMTQTFMNITPQVLTLLGIGGGTAAISKLQTVARLRNIPANIRNLIKTDRIPRLSDLIMSGDQPNITKFQMLVFTIIIAGTVFKEICYGYSFPELTDGLLALMGISSAIYIGTDLTKPISEEDLKNKIREFNDLTDRAKKAQPMKSFSIRAELPSVLQNKLDSLKEMIDAYLQ